MEKLLKPWPPAPMSAAELEDSDDESFYPDTDGEPMAESDFQRKPLTYAVEALDLYFAEHPDVYVSGNLLIYYEKGNNRLSVAPDVFVVFGVAKHDRNIYRTWVEGKSPDVVIEITSNTTRLRDEREKPELYRKLGVGEYFQYDPTGDYLEPALKGRRLSEQKQYAWILPRPLSRGRLSLESQVLGLELHLEKGTLRFFDVKRRIYLRDYAEEVAAHKKTQTRARTTALERTRAKKQLVRAEKQLEMEARARTEAEIRATEAETQWQMEMRARAEAEIRLREAESCLRKMEAELQRLRGETA